MTLNPAAGLFKRPSVLIRSYLVLSENYCNCNSGDNVYEKF